MTIETINDTATYVDADGDVAKALGFYVLNQVLRVVIDGGANINVSGSSVTTAQANANALLATDGANVPLSVNLNRELRTTDAASAAQLASIAALLAAMNSNETAIRNALNTVSTTVSNVLSATTALQTTVAAGNASEATIASQTATLTTALAAVQTAQANGLTSLGVLHTDSLALDTLVTSANTALGAIQTATGAGATAAGQASALTQLTALNTAAANELTKLDAITAAVNTAVTTLGGGKSLSDIVTAITTANSNIVVTDADLKSMSSALNLTETNQLTQLTAVNTALGSTSDTQATSDAGAFSLLAFIKRGLSNWTSLLARVPALGQTVKAASVPVTIASDQGAIPTSLTVAGAALSTANPVPVSVVSLGTTGTGRALVTTGWKVVTAATGYAVGDYLDQIDEWDATQNPTAYLSTTWRNISQNTTLASAPNLANLTQSIASATSVTVLNPSTNYAAETGGNLATIATNTAQGTAATGVTPAAGGVGLFGWLSSISSYTSHIPTLGQKTMAAALPVSIASDQSTLPVADANNAAFQGVVAMTVGTAYPAQRSIGIVCTAAGNVQLTLSDSSSITVPVSVGFQTFPFAVTSVASAGTTATATYYNLK